MSYNTRVVSIDRMDKAEGAVAEIGVDPAAVAFLAPKAVHVNIRLSGVSSYAANILKQEMLGKGGDAAVHAGVVNCGAKKSDVLLMGTYSQYYRLLHKLGMQKGSLKEIAVEIEELLASLQNGRHRILKCGKYSLPLGDRTYLMGILNVTPDSFSDGGVYNTLEAAVNRAKEMVEEGADMIDVGGESTRPGHKAVDADEEARRVIPVIESLVRILDVPVSIDTSKAVVAVKALDAGAHAVNDIWGLQRDGGMAAAAARSGAGVVVMHNRGDTDYTDLMGDIAAFLRKSVEIACGAGIDRDSIVVDPGIGFGKTTSQNIEVVRRIGELRSLGLPILMGTSRKSVIGNTLSLPAGERLEGTAATVALGISSGVDIIRIHDVREMKRVAAMTDAIIRG